MQDKQRYVVGTDIGGSHICSAVIDVATGEILSQPEVTPVDCNAEANAILDAWQRNIRATAVAFGRKVNAVGMAFPGPFDYDNGISLIHGVDKYESLFGLDVRLSLSARLSDVGISRFRFVNDASAFALGECLGGAARGASRVVALTLGTGVGSGFVSHGRLVVSGDMVPMCGWVYHLPFEDGIVDEAFSTRWICRRYKELTGNDVTGAREVADRCAADEKASQLFDEYGRRLAEFAVPVLRQFDSNVLLLGGNISRAYNLFAPSLMGTIADSGYVVDVKVSTLLDKAALVGAASLFKTDN